MTSESESNSSAVLSGPVLPSPDDSGPGIATDYGLDGPESNPDGDKIFSARPDRP